MEARSMDAMALVYAAPIAQKLRARMFGPRVHIWDTRTFDLTVF